MRKAYPNLIAYARDMRGSLTAAEAALWRKLRGRNPGKWRWQHPMHGHVLDFYCPAARLCIDVDGGIHETEQQCVRDAARTAALTGKGIRVIRVRKDEVLHRLDSVLIHIERYLSRPDNPLPPAGEGGARQRAG